MKVVLTYTQCNNHQVFNSMMLPVLEELNNFYQQDKVKKFMVIDPSRTKTGSQNESVKYRITASLWADKESLDKFYYSKAHLNTMKMQAQGYVQNTKIVVKDLSSEQKEECAPFTKLIDEAFSSEHGYLRWDSLSPFAIVTEENASVMLQMMGASSTFSVE